MLDGRAFTALVASVEPVVVFFVEGDHWTEFPRREAIPWESALDAARRFLEIGKLPENVDWQEV
jgi:hypothetical protein